MSNNTNQQPDFTQAPEGATHYHKNLDGVQWFSNNDGAVYRWTEGDYGLEWVLWSKHPANVRALIAEATKIPAQPDWSKAPADATHYLPVYGSPNGSFYEKRNGKFYRTPGGGVPVNIVEQSRLIPRPAMPAQPQWNGEGLPPAGTLCEVFYRGDWYKTYIIGTAQNGATVYCSKNIHNDQIYDGHQNPECFRPIRTEREKFTTKVREIFGKVESQVISDLANALYDANARFPENSK